MKNIIKKKFNKIKFFILLFLLGMTFSGCSLKDLFPNQDSSKLTLADIPNAMNIAIGWLVVGAGSIAMLFFIVGGLIYITSFGNEEKAELGKKTLMYALIGAIIILVAYALVKFFLGFALQDSGKVFPE